MQQDAEIQHFFSMLYNVFINQRVLKTLKHAHSPH
jgi:hypothetical protein